MGNWHKTGCVLCAQNCGLEVFTEDGRMTKVRPDYAERGAAKAVHAFRCFPCREGY